MLDLEVLYRLDNARGDEQKLLVDARKVLERIHKTGRACTEKRACLAGDYRTVGKLDGNSGAAGFFCLFKRLCDNGTVVGGKAYRVHDKLDLAHLLGRAETLTQRAGSGVVAADYLLL